MASFDGQTFGAHVQWGKCAHDANDLLCVAYGNGIFVGVGGWSQPRVVVSADGKSWKEADAEQFKGRSGGAHRVVFANGAFHLISLGGALMRSRDGMQWRHISDVPLQRKPKHQRIRSFAIGNGHIVGVGDFGVIATSADDGRTWKIAQAPHHGEDRTWPWLAFGAGRFVITGLNGYTASSRDGITWEHATTHDGQFSKVTLPTWTGKEFLAYATPVKKGAPFRLRSTDGVTWTIRRQGWLDPQMIWRFGDTYYGNRDNFFKGDTHLYRSRDGLEWEKLENERGYSARWLAGSALPLD